MKRKSLAACSEAIIAKSAPTMSQAMRTARHKHGGRCDSYKGGSRRLSRISVKLKQFEMEKDSRVDNDRTKHYAVRNIAARLFSQQIYYSENYEQN